MTSRKLGFLFLLLLVPGCEQSRDSYRSACISQSLQQPNLRNGVAVFTETDGSAGIVSITWRGKTRIATNSHYPAASLTKLLVAAEIKEVIATRRIRLDSPVEKLLPDHAFTGNNTKQVTVGHLLQHTSGIGNPRGADPLWFRHDSEPTPDCAAAAHYALAFPTEYPPGYRTTYSNVGYCLLANILLRLNEDDTSKPILEPELQRVLQSPHGGAGGWNAPLPSIYFALLATLPLEILPPPPLTLPDGSWYNHGWRWWPQPQAGPPWTHTGRLQGFLAVALTDGRNRLLVAHFDGDPADYHAAAEHFGRQAWACMT